MGSVEVIVFPRDYEANRDLLTEDAKLFIRGRVSLGDEPVGKLTLEDVRKLYRELQKNRRVAEHPVYGYGLSGTMVRRIHGVLHQAMEAAVRENLIARNPTEGITRPRRKRPPSRSSTTPS